jgi:putative DNA-binding protein
VSLVDLQRQVRQAVIGVDSAAIAPLLTGGVDPARRFDIHRRHYEESLTAAVVGRFPATGWLIGPASLENAARAFVHAHPPTAPCIAEYGTTFPSFLSTSPETADLTYVPAFADLDWHLGRLAVSVDSPPVTVDDLRRMDTHDLAASVVTIQRGTHYAQADWAVDTLISMYLANSSPDSWTLPHEEVHLEARGCRGQFRFARLRASEFAFREALSRGHRLGDAAGYALALDDAFDPGRALLVLLNERLITAIEPQLAGGRL